jgi:hypothetical protein
MAQRSGFGHGRYHRIVYEGGALWTLAPESTHLIDATLASSPRHIASMTRAQNLAAYYQVPYNAAWIPINPGWHNNFWLDVMPVGAMAELRPNSVTMRGAIEQAQQTLGASKAFIRAGDYGYAVADVVPPQESQAIVSLQIYDMRIAAGFGIRPLPLAQLELGNVTNQGDSSKYSLWISEDQQRVGVIANSSTTADPPHFWLALVDVSSPSAPRLESRIDHNNDIGSAVAVAGERLLVLSAANPNGNGGVAEFSAQQLVVYDITASGSSTTLQQRSVLALMQDVPTTEPGFFANHFLSFDGNNAFISSNQGILVVDVAAVTPRLLTTIALSQRPTSAVFINDHLYVSGETQISVISPPCPPR